MSVSTTLETKRLSLHPRQREFARTRADIAVFGGSAGGGKSYILEYEPIGRELHKVRGFTAVVFRRNSRQITNPGGLWDQAGEIYPYAGGRAVIGMLEYRFSSGARIAFRHIEHENDKHQYQGAEFCNISFDELSHFSESQFWYLTSRNRSTCGVHPYVRATCNPDPGWIKTTLLSPWVDEEFEGKRALSGELRWFIRDEGKMHWVDEGTPFAKSVTFIRSRLSDNPTLLAKNPEYEATLRALPPIERARLLDGDWNVRREGLVYYRPQHGLDFQQCIVNALPFGLHGQPFGGMDFGIHAPFCAVWGVLDHDDVLWITGCRYQSGMTTPVHSQALPKGVRWWCDPASPESRILLRQDGHDVVPCKHLMTKGATGEVKKPILSGIDVVAERIRTGRLKIHREACLPLIREFGLYQYDPLKLSDEPVKENDHSMDALRYIITGISRGHIPFDARADELIAKATEDAIAREKAKKEAAMAEKVERQQKMHDSIDAEIWWR